MVTIAVVLHAVTTNASELIVSRSDCLINESVRTCQFALSWCRRLIITNASLGRNLLLDGMCDLNGLNLHLATVVVMLGFLTGRSCTVFPSLPARLEELAHLEAWERMSFGVEDDICQR